MIEFDKEGRYLLMHHNGAAWYYKWNFAFMFGFTAFTFNNYKNNTQVFFGKEWLGKLYLGLLVWGIVSTWFFAHKHINNIWLLKCGK